MLSLLGLIFGFLSGALPKFLEMWKDRQDKKHELAILEIQRQMQAQGHTERMEEIGAQADMAESEAIYKYAKVEPLPYTGNKFIDFLLGLANVLVYLLNGLVRPLVTFGFVGLYAYIKHAGFSIHKRIDLVWTETDQAIFATVVGHWFGQRAMRWAAEHYDKRNNKK